MTNPEQGTASQEQAPQSTPPAPQQASVYTPPEPTPPVQEAPSGPSPDEIAALRQQAQTAQQYQAQLQQREESYKHLQAEYTRSRQALAQLAGANGSAPQQQQDPLAPYIKDLTDQGYAEKDARAIAGLSYKMIQPLQQQFQQTTQSLQSQTMIDATMRAAYSQDPALMSDPNIYASVEATLRQGAMQGMQIDAKQAIYSALIAQYDAKQAQATQQRQPGMPPLPQQQPAPQPFANGVFQPGTGYPMPQQAAQNRVTPEQQSASNWIRENLKLPHKQ